MKHHTIRISLSHRLELDLDLDLDDDIATFTIVNIGKPTYKHSQARMAHSRCAPGEILAVAVAVKLALVMKT